MRARLGLAGCSVLIGVSLADGQERLPASCDLAPGASRSGVVGQVVDVATRLPLQGAGVRIEWDQRGQRQQLELVTDAGGRFSACSVPAETRLRVTAEFGPATGRTFLTLESAEVRTVLLEMDAPKTPVGGRVVEEGSSRGIVDAELRIAGTNVQATTGPEGVFRLPGMPPGTYALTTSHVAYGERTDSVRVDHGVSVQYVIGLTTAAIQLSPIEVVVRSHVLEQRGFYEREQRGSGVYLTRFAWEKRMPQLPSDILRSVAGVRVTARRGGFGNVILDRGNCPFRYFVDGARVGETFSLDDIPVEWLEALEVYRGVSSVPGEFTASAAAANANCGVIVVWTRGAR
jgi:hypothetical protein